MIVDISQLSKTIGLTHEDEIAARQAAEYFPFGVSRYYAGLIVPGNRNCPVRRQVIPCVEELRVDRAEAVDPLSEDLDSPVPGLTHRYPDRVLLLVTNRCFTYCRHCNRRRKVGDIHRDISMQQVQAGIAYIRDNSQVREVILSGGDPLTLPNDVLATILDSLRCIPHVGVIRIGTRAPVVQPGRINAQLVEMLSVRGPVWVNTHFNHPVELTDASRSALACLVDGGIPTGNQTVLLRGINDSVTILKELFYRLVENRVRPYYLFQCDLAQGVGHFRTSVGRGLEIMECLRGHMSSYAVPVYAIDPPGGAGKIPMSPSYLLNRGETELLLRNYEGVITRYTEGKLSSMPLETTDTESVTTGVGGLFGQPCADHLVPEGLVRKRRRNQS